MPRSAALDNLIDKILSNTTSKGNTSMTGLTDVNSKTAKERIQRTLAEYNGGHFSADQGVAFHKDPPNKISLPNGMTPAQGAKALGDVAIALDQTEVFHHTFKYRPWDGAHALVQVLSKYFGTTGRGKAIQSFFGSTPPQQIEIEVSETETVQVPWGHIEFAALDGTLMLGTTMDAEYGMLFQLSIECPKRYGAMVAGFFRMIEDELHDFSIYKGKSVRTSRSKEGVDEMRFIRTALDPTIVYTDEVNAALENTVWGVIRNAELLKSDGRKLNNRVLVHGPYGTGKSECGKITGQIANDNGWTFLKFESATGSLEELERTIATARLYQPAVVMIEDVDVFASREDGAYQSKLSNMFDGLGSKNDEVMLLMTSNRAAEFSKGMLRAGRIDRMIEIGPLDQAATERMIKTVIGEQRLDKDIDYNEVWEALTEFEPAFVRQTFDQAATAALIRTGTRDFTLSTADFVNAAHILRPQHDLHASRSDAKRKVTLEDLIGKAVADAIVSKVDSRIELEGDIDVEGKVIYGLHEVERV
jgi:transitional endoplasmic reticulum ATPase